MNAPAKNQSQSSLLDFHKNTDARMTSREISSVTGKEHHNIMRDIKLLIDQGCLCELSFELTSNSVPMPRGGFRKEPMYTLDFHATLTLVTGYNAMLRSKVIARWMELENQPTTPTPIRKSTGPTGPGYRVFDYNGRGDLVTYTDNMGVAWFRARDLITCLGYIAKYEQYAWMFRDGNMISLLKEDFVSPGHLRNLTKRSGKTEKWAFRSWIDSHVLPELGQTWRIGDETNNPAPQARGEVVSKYLLTFDSNNKPVIHELLSYRSNATWNEAPEVPTTSIEAFYRKDDLPARVIAKHQQFQIAI